MYLQWLHPSGEDVPACMTPFDLSLRRPPSTLPPPDMWKSACEFHSDGRRPLPQHEIDNSREYPLERRRPLPLPKIDNSRGVKTRPFDVEKKGALEMELLLEAFPGCLRKLMNVVGILSRNLTLLKLLLMWSLRCLKP